MQTSRFMLFKNSNVYKNTFTIASLLSILALSLAILFGIDSFPLSETSFKKTTHKTFILLVVWTGGTIINKNLHISKNGDIASYVISLFLNSFLISIVFFRSNHLPKTIFESVEEVYYYYLVLIVANFLWRVVLYFFEKKTRPYFSKYLFWNSLAMLMLIAISNVAYWNLEKYYFDEMSYNHLEVPNLLVILFMPIVIFIFLYSSITSYSRFAKYSKIERDSSREVILWNAFFRITSIAIWATWTIQIKIEDFNLYDKIYAGISLFFCLFSFVAIIISIIKKQSRFLVYVFTTNLLIMSTLGFIFVNVLKSTPSDTFLMFIIFTIIFHIMFILIKPKSYRFYPQLNSKLSFFLIIFTLFIWSGNKIIGEINFLGINELIWATMLVFSLLMFSLQIFSELLFSTKLNWKFSKIIKYINIENKLKDQKGVANV